MTTIEVLEMEALRHFETGRYEDAAKTYKYLLEIQVKNGDFLKIIRYGMEAVQAWKKTDTPEKSASVLFKIGTECLRMATENKDFPEKNSKIFTIGTGCIRAAAQFFEQIGRQELENKPAFAATALKKAGICYEYLGNIEKRNQLLEEAATIYRNEAENSENNGNKLESVVLYECAKDCFKAAGKQESADQAIYLAIRGMLQYEKDHLETDETSILSEDAYLRVADTLERMEEEELADRFREVAKRLYELHH